MFYLGKDRSRSLTFTFNSFLFSDAWKIRSLELNWKVQILVRFNSTFSSLGFDNQFIYCKDKVLKHVRQHSPHKVFKYRVQLDFRLPKRTNISDSIIKLTRRYQTKMESETITENSGDLKTEVELKMQANNIKYSIVLVVVNSIIFSEINPINP